MSENTVIDVKCNVLSIDAWKGQEGGWFWNAWYKIGKISESTIQSFYDNGKLNNRTVLKWFRDEGYLSDNSKGKLSIEDDQYNIVIQLKGTKEPVYAIEYGTLD